MIKVDIVCPIYKNIEHIKRFLNNLSFQKNIEIINLVFPHTLCNDDVIDSQIFELVKNNKYFCLKKDDFSHSLTREKAVREYCVSNIVIFMSQDVILNSENSIYNLAKVINNDIVYAYGRQICTNHSIEKYIRKKNYGEVSKLIDSSMIDEMQIMAFFASDAFSAINREKFIELNGYQGYDVMMNEDQLYSKFVLDAGYKKMYVADAIVEHSHKYTLKQLYKRYYETGIFYKRICLFEKYKSINSGIYLAVFVLKEALKNFDILVLLRFLPDMCARYIGMKRGKK